MFEWLRNKLKEGYEGDVGERENIAHEEAINIIDIAIYLLTLSFCYKGHKQMLYTMRLSQLISWKCKCKTQFENEKSNLY